MKKLIVIDDDSSTIELYKRYIKYYLPEVEAEFITDAEKALRRVVKNSFDLLICDVNLKHPKIDGFKIARLAYAQGKPIIFITGTGITKKLQFYAFYPDMVKTVKYLPKPIKKDTFVNTIKEFLQIDIISSSVMFDKLTV